MSSDKQPVSREVQKAVARGVLLERMRAGHRTLLVERLGLHDPEWAKTLHIYEVTKRSHDFVLSGECGLVRCFHSLLSLVRFLTNDMFVCSVVDSE